MADLPASVASRLDVAIQDSWALMDRIGQQTRGRVGITRPPYDAAEQHAARLTEAAARAAGLAVEFDGFGNLHALLPGRDATAPAIGLGSHFDSVPDGGNFDGLAGVMSGLAVLGAVHAAGIRPARSLRLVGLRGEESPWYGTAYLGSRMALGHVPFAILGQLRRLDTGRRLADHMAELGFTGQVQPVLSPANLACWLELHIEQGPLLIARDLPLGIATAIRGNIRHPQARCFGAWAHSAAVPRPYRSDAVVAVSELIMRIDDFWSRRIAAGDDNFVATIGQFSTNPALHAMTKVAGEVAFSVNLGGTDPLVLAEAKILLTEAVAAIEADRHVRFDLGTDVGTPPTPLDAGLMAILEKTAQGLGFGYQHMPTVGHDSGMFALAGIPAAMLLVRNQNGSHNPDETMQYEDYAAGVRVLAAAAMQLATAG